MYDAVIFDLDGLLVDSEPMQYRAFNEVCSRYGHPLAVDEYLSWRDSKLTTQWADAHGLDVDPDLVREEKKAIYEGLIRDEIVLKPGARALVEGLVERTTLCIASGSRAESIAACLDKFDLSGCFAHCVSASEVAHGKPHPGLFFEAASRAGALASRSLVIENAANGLRAAVAAGMDCIVCPDSFAPEPMAHYAEATLLVESLELLSDARVGALCRS